MSPIIPIGAVLALFYVVLLIGTAWARDGWPAALHLAAVSAVAGALGVAVALLVKGRRR